MEKTRLTLEQQTEEVRVAVDDKLKTAAAQRDENIKKMVDRLKEHVSIIFFILNKLYNCFYSGYFVRLNTKKRIIDFVYGIKVHH